MTLTFPVTGFCFAMFFLDNTGYDRRILPPDFPPLTCSYSDHCSPRNWRFGSSYREFHLRSSFLFTRGADLRSVFASLPRGLSSPVFHWLSPVFSPVCSFLVWFSFWRARPRRRSRLDSLVLLPPSPYVSFLSPHVPSSS